MADKLEDTLNKLAVIEQSEEVELPNFDLLKQAKLTSLEKAEAESFIVLGMPGLSQYPKARMLESYLSGMDTVELLELFPGTSIGGISYLKFKDQWVEKRKDFLEDLTYKTKLKTIQTKSNAIGTIASLIDAFHKELQPQIMKYIQTGDKTNLPPRFRIRGFNDYAKFLKLFENMAKVAAVTNNTKNVQENYYPPMTIQTGTVNITDKKEEKIIEVKKPEELSNDSFSFLQEIYSKDDKNE